MQPENNPIVKPDYRLRIDSAFRDMLEPGEQPLAVVKRHPIGIIGLYLEALIGVIAILALIFIIAPDVLNDFSKQSNRLIIGGSVFAIAIVALVLLIATYIYRLSKLLITDKNLIQITQSGLFLRNTARLSIANVEDVNAEQRGILQTIFNYGTLHIQTAGERPNFIFKTCPDPNRYAGRINEARQLYAESLKEAHTPAPPAPGNP